MWLDLYCLRHKVNWGRRSRDSWDIDTNRGKTRNWSDGNRDAVAF